MEFHFRKCSEQDLPALHNISRSTFKEAFEAQNNPEDFKYYMDKAFSIEVLHKELCTLGTSFYFVFMGNSLAGYFKINEGEAQSDIKDYNSLELERIYVLAEFQGKGIGRKILDVVKQKAKIKKKKYVWLGVWQLNPEAIKFYKAHDFVIFGEHPYYIGKDRQMDWLMRFDID